MRNNSVILSIIRKYIISKGGVSVPKRHRFKRILLKYSIWLVLIGVDVVFFLLTDRFFPLFFIIQYLSYLNNFESNRNFRGESGVDRGL